MINFGVYSQMEYTSIPPTYGMFQEERDDPIVEDSSEQPRFGGLELGTLRVSCVRWTQHL